MKVLREYLEIAAWNGGSRYPAGKPKPSLRSGEFWRETWAQFKADALGSAFWSLMLAGGLALLALAGGVPELYVRETQHVSWQAAALGVWCLTAAILGQPLWIREGRRRRDSGEYTRGGRSFALLQLGFVTGLLGVGVALTVGRIPGLFIPAWYAGMSLAGIALVIICGGPVSRALLALAGALPTLGGRRSST